MTYISASLRQLVIDRAQNCCEYCRVSQEDNPFTYHIEHIISEKHGGDTVAENLCLSCPDCNAYKGSDIASFDPETGGLTGLFHPRINTWADHFQLEPDTALIVPLSSIGRVTVRLLRVNSIEQVDARKLLLRLGRYPCGGHRT